MGTRDTYQKTLMKACIVSGDETALTEMFLRAVDIVLASTKQHVADTHALLDRIKQHRES